MILTVSKTFTIFPAFKQLAPDIYCKVKIHSIFKCISKMAFGLLICKENFQSVKVRPLSIFLWIHSLQFLELYYPTPEKRKYRYVSQMKWWLPLPEGFEVP